MKPIHLISPVDGSVYAERMPLSPAAAEAVVARAKAAQKPWAARPLADRIALVKAGVARLNAMKDVVVAETAWQMGRPTRYGGEFGGVNARTDYMSDIAAATLAPAIPPPMTAKSYSVVIPKTPLSHSMPDCADHRLRARSRVRYLRQKQQGWRSAGALHSDGSPRH